MGIVFSETQPLGQGAGLLYLLGKKNYPGWTAWVFYLLSLCYAYLALSGLFFAWFVPGDFTDSRFSSHVAAWSSLRHHSDDNLILKGPVLSARAA